MRVALDATYSVGEQISGIGVYSRRILYGLGKAHPETELWWCYRPHRWLRSWLEPLGPNCRRWLLLDRWPPKSDVFHGLNQRLPQGRLKRAVTTFHDLFVLTGEYSPAEFRRRFAALAQDAARRSDLIIAVSEFTAGQVHELLGVERGRIRVIPHGATCYVPMDCEQTLVREKMILHVGAIQKRKNLLRLIEAFEQAAPGWRLVLAGSLGYGAEEILQRIRTSRRRAEIEVLGYVPERELGKLYERASVLAFPSLDEGFGMPVLDAMASGVAVLTSNRSATLEVAGDAAWLVDPEDTESIAEGLRRMTSDAALRAELAWKGRKRASLFRWENAVEATWGVYKELGA